MGGEHSGHHLARGTTQDIAFLRQLLEDGNHVLVSTKDKNILYEKEI